MIRTMYAVAQSAVFNYRIMLPQEGAAFFCVAAIAIVINRKLFQACWAERAMGVMAVAAHQFVFADRVG